MKSQTKHQGLKWYSKDYKNTFYFTDIKAIGLLIGQRKSRYSATRLSEDDNPTNSYIALYFKVNFSYPWELFLCIIFFWQIKNWTFVHILPLYTTERWSLDYPRSSTDSLSSFLTLGSIPLATCSQNFRKIGIRIKLKYRICDCRKSLISRYKL